MTARLIRHKDLPDYLGIKTACFNRHVRPHIPEIRIGSRGIAFDTIDLDDWIQQKKQVDFLKKPLRVTDRPLEENHRPKKPSTLNSSCPTLTFQEYLIEQLKKHTT